MQYGDSLRTRTQSIIHHHPDWVSTISAAWVPLVLLSLALSSFSRRTTSRAREFPSGSEKRAATTQAQPVCFEEACLHSWPCLCRADSQQIPLQYPEAAVIHTATQLL